LLAMMSHHQPGTSALCPEVPALQPPDYIQLLEF